MLPTETDGSEDRTEAARRAAWNPAGGIAPMAAPGDPVPPPPAHAAI